MTNYANVENLLRATGDVVGLVGSFVSGLRKQNVSEVFGLSRNEYEKTVEDGVPSCSVNDIPDYCGHPFEIIENNTPHFLDAALSLPVGYESYSELDGLGRCGAALALVGKETMPTQDEARKTIKHVKPSGWHDVEYAFIEGGRLYHRCHLIGYDLTAEQDNPRNLFTGTSYLNHAMRVFENMMTRHCKTGEGNRVTYRATPVFRGEELVVRGVQLEALSELDDSEPLGFNVFLHNVQPGVRIDYATGESSADETVRDSMLRNCVVNERSKTFHRASCSAAKTVSEGNVRSYSGMRGDLLQSGYLPCSKCRP